jgi:hypothetical protein
VLAVQHALAPDRGRSFPITVELEHDFAAWYADMLHAKDGHMSSWPTIVAPLSTYEPATLPVDDPVDACGRAVGRGIEEYMHLRWELASPVGYDVAELGSPV